MLRSTRMIEGKMQIFYENTRNKKYFKSDIEFIYNGKATSFCPLDVYVVGYEGEPNEFTNIDEAINAKVFDGKSLLDIWDDISSQFS